MVEIRIATNDDIELLMSSRLEMLKVVNDLPADYVYDDVIVNESRDYFLNGLFASYGKARSSDECIHKI